MTYDLTGKVAVVTGGSGVLGAGFCKALAAAGACVAVCGRRMDAAQAVVDEIRADGGEAMAVSMNVVDKAAVEAARDAIYAVYGKVDILVNGAGGNNPKGSTSRADKIITHTPMGRFGKPEDLDGTLLWLADEKFSAFVSGVVIPVDGGFAAYAGV